MENINNTVTLNFVSMNLFGYDVESFDIQNTANKAVGWVKDRAPKLNLLLNGENADVIGLQETSAPWLEQIQGFNGYKFAGEASSECGADCNIIYKDGKFDVLESGRYYLTRSGKSQRDWDSDHIRAASWVVFKHIETGVIFMFTSTHLDNNGKIARVEEAKMIVAHVTAKLEEIKNTYSLENVPAFVVGDMNCSAFSVPTPYDVFTQAFKDTRRNSSGETVCEEYSTSPGMWYAATPDAVKKDRHSIDHIFFTGMESVNSYKMIHTATNLCEYGEYISDHNAVVVNATIANK